MCKTLEIISVEFLLEFLCNNYGKTILNIKVLLNNKKRCMSKSWKN